jgi:hypothetical protein
MNDRDIEYIQNRLGDPGPAPEAAQRLKAGQVFTSEVVLAAAQFIDRLRNVRYRLAGREDMVREEFTGVDTPADDPRHVEQVINHIAHLEDWQVDEITKELINQKVRRDLGVDPGVLPGESDPSGPEANKAAGEWG